MAKKASCLVARHHDNRKRPARENEEMMNSWMMKRSLLVLATCVVLAGCAGDQQSTLDADDAAVKKGLEWLAARQKDVPPPDTRERSPAAFLSRITQGDTEGVRALCTEKGFRDVERLGLDRIKNITLYPPALPSPWSDEKDEDNARFVYIRPGLGGKTLCVIEMRKVGDEWHVDAVTDTSRQKSQ